MRDTYCLSRLKWEAIRVQQLFLEHVLLKHSFEKGIAQMIRLNIVSMYFHAGICGSSEEICYIVITPSCVPVLVGSVWV